MKLESQQRQNPRPLRQRSERASIVPSPCLLEPATQHTLHVPRPTRLTQRSSANSVDGGTTRTSPPRPAVLRTNLPLLARICSKLRALSPTPAPPYPLIISHSRPSNERWG